MSLEETFNITGEELDKAAREARLAAAADQSKQDRVATYVKEYLDTLKFSELALAGRFDYTQELNPNGDIVFYVTMDKKPLKRFEKSRVTNEGTFYGGIYGGRYEYHHTEKQHFLYLLELLAKTAIEAAKQPMPEEPAPAAIEAPKRKSLFGKRQKQLTM